MKLLSELQSDNWILVQTDFELAAVKEEFGITDPDITGAVVNQKRTRVYFTEAAAPFALDAIYHAKSYYTPKGERWNE